MRTQGDLGVVVGSVRKVHFKWKSGWVMNYSCFGRADWEFIFLASYMIANLLIIHWRTMDRPQVAWEVEWARAVSTVSILNETIILHAWKNHLESSPPHPCQLQLESIQLMKKTLEKCLPPFIASLAAELEGSKLPRWIQRRSHA